MSKDESKPWEQRKPLPDEDSAPEPAARLIANARKRVKAPAIALIAVGIINTCLGLFVAVMGFVVGGMNLGQAEGAIGVINAFAGVAIVAGGLSLQRLDNYGLARTGSITAMVPCISLCLILGLPVGVWALVTSSSPDVKAAFRAVRRQDEDEDW